MKLAWLQLKKKFQDISAIPAYSNSSGGFQVFLNLSWAVCLDSKDMETHLNQALRPSR